MAVLYFENSINQSHSISTILLGSFAKKRGTSQHRFLFARCVKPNPAHLWRQKRVEHRLQGFVVAQLCERAGKGHGANQSRSTCHAFCRLGGEECIISIRMRAHCRTTRACQSSTKGLCCWPWCCCEPGGGPCIPISPGITRAGWGTTGCRMPTGTTPVGTLTMPIGTHRGSILVAFMLALMSIAVPS